MRVLKEAFDEDGKPLRHSEIKERTSLSSDNIAKPLKDLQDSRKIIKDTSKGRNGPYYLTDSLHKYKGEYKFGEDVLYEKRRDHTKELKRVIERWLDEIPTASDDIFVDSLLEEELRLPVEVDEKDLFDDLRFHLAYHSERIFVAWDEYKKLWEEYLTKASELKENIESDLTDAINSVLSTDSGSAELKISGESEINSISIIFAQYIYDVCKKLAKDGTVKPFNSTVIYGSKNSTIDGDVISQQCFCTYCHEYLDGDEYDIHREEEPFVTIKEGLMSGSEFKSKMDTVVEEMMGRAETDYCEKVREINRLIRNLNAKKEQIQRLLNAQLPSVVFEGSCKYLLPLVASKS